MGLWKVAIPGAKAAKGDVVVTPEQRKLAETFQTTLEHKATVEPAKVRQTLVGLAVRAMREGFSSYRTMVKAVWQGEKKPSGQGQRYFEVASAVEFLTRPEVKDHPEAIRLHEMLVEGIKTEGIKPMAVAVKEKVKPALQEAGLVPTQKTRPEPTDEKRQRAFLKRLARLIADTERGYSERKVDGKVVRTMWDDEEKGSGIKPFRVGYSLVLMSIKPASGPALTSETVPIRQIGEGSENPLDDKPAETAPVEPPLVKVAA